MTERKCLVVESWFQEEENGDTWDKFETYIEGFKYFLDVHQDSFSSIVYVYLLNQF